MNAFLLIMLKSTLCLSVLYGLYVLLLKRRTPFLLNRLTLLFVMAASLSIPLMQKPFSFGNSTFAAVLPEIEVEERAETAENLPDGRFVISDERGGEKAGAVAVTQVSVLEQVRQWLPAVYFAGLAVCLAGMLVSLFCVLRIVFQARKVVFGGQKILVSRSRVDSFTFAGWIVLSENDFRWHANEIVIHENIHRRKAHWTDICLANVMIVLQWFNPLVWALRRELRAVHEYEADYYTLNQGIDAEKYQLLLIEKTAGASRFAIASSFAQSKIKNRLIMMNKKFNSRLRWRVLFFIPMTALLTQAFARQKNEYPVRDMYAPTFQTGDDVKNVDSPFDGRAIFSPEVNDDDTLKSSSSNSQTSIFVSNSKERTIVITQIFGSSPDFSRAIESAAKISGDSLFSKKVNVEKILEKFAKMENTPIMYNHRETTLGEARKELNAFSEKHKWKPMVSYSSKIGSGDGGEEHQIGFKFPEIDQNHPQMYYVINGKWHWHWNGDATLVKTIETLEGADAVQRFGKKAANGAIVITTAVPEKWTIEFTPPSYDNGQTSVKKDTLAVTQGNNNEKK